MSDISKGQFFVGDKSDPEPLGTETKLYSVFVIASSIWFAVGVIYILLTPRNFIRMWPHEFGSWLSGWFAPVAVILFLAAVTLQRRQLDAQRTQNDQTRAELRRSITELERNTLTSQFQRLSTRMMHGTLRLVRVVETRLQHLTKQGRRERVPDIVGRYRRYAEFFKAKEPSLMLKSLGTGFDALVSRMKDDCVLHAEFEDVEELGAELRSLIEIVCEMQQVAGRIGSCGDDPLLAESVLERFRTAAESARETLESLLGSLREFDDPDDPASDADPSVGEPQPL